MTTNEKTILDLVASMERAKTTGQTDDAQEASIVAAQQLAREVREICYKFHDKNDGPLSAHLIARTLSILLGSIVQANAEGNPTRTLLLTAELSTLMFDVASKEIP